MECLAMQRLVAGVLVGVFLFGGGSLSGKDHKTSMMLVETYSMHPCAGLDCPPWPISDDAGFCFQSGDSYFVGAYYSRGLPWTTKGAKLLALKGQSIEVIITDKDIKVVDARIKVNLKRVHNDSFFKSEPCRSA
jgi:hypothetical protein